MEKMTRLVFRLDRSLSSGEASYLDMEFSRFTGVQGYELKGNQLGVDLEPTVVRLQFMWWIIAILAGLGITAYFVSEIVKEVPWELIASLAIVGVSLYAVVRYVWG